MCLVLFNDCWYVLRYSCSAASPNLELAEPLECLEPLVCKSLIAACLPFRRLASHSQASSLSYSSTSRSSARQSRLPAAASRRNLEVLATLVGPDPRLATDSLSGLASSQTLQGRDVEEAAMWRCIDLHSSHPGSLPLPRLSKRWSPEIMDDAYERCGSITSEFAKTFYLGTQLMTPEQARAVWAIYVWCRRTDELVDGPNASRITPKVSRTLVPFCIPSCRPRRTFLLTVQCRRLSVLDTSSRPMHCCILMRFATFAC